MNCPPKIKIADVHVKNVAKFSQGHEYVATSTLFGSLDKLCKCCIVCETNWVCRMLV